MFTWRRTAGNWFSASGFRRKVRAADRNLDVISREIVGKGLDKGWTRTGQDHPEEAMCLAPLQGMKAKGYHMKKTFVSCEVLNTWKRLRASTCKGHNLKKYLQGELESQNVVPGGP